MSGKINSDHRSKITCNSRVLNFTSNAIESVMPLKTDTTPRMGLLDKYICDS